MANSLQRRLCVPKPRTVAGVVIRDELIPRSPGNPSMRVRLYTPAVESEARPALLWMHGGGFVIGVPEQDEAQNVTLCQQLGLVIAAVDYRLSPEHPYPAALDDGYTALIWLQRRANELGVARDRIAIGGNSAGGGLAAGLVLMAHDLGEVPVAFQLLIYPMLDDRTVNRTDVDERRLRFWSTKSNRLGWESYLGSKPGSDAVPAYAAPARRENLGGLPPAWIGVGTCDLFHDEVVSYAQRLAQAEVPCALKVIEGAFHAFDFAGSKTRVVREFRQAYFDALRDALI